MSLIGVSLLEMRQMIEQACLPDRCEVSCQDGASLSIRYGVQVGLPTVVPLNSLNSSRDIAALVMQLRREQQRPALTRIRVPA